MESFTNNYLCYYCSLKDIYFPLDKNDLELTIIDFLQNSELEKLELSRHLSSTDRRYGHEVCLKLLETKKYPNFVVFSRGASQSRRMIIKKGELSPDEFVQKESRILLKCRTRFVADFKLPVPEVSSPYYEYYLNLWDPILGTLEMADMFEKNFKDLGKDFESTGSELLKKITSTIQSIPTYKKYSKQIKEIQKKFPLENDLESKGSHIFINENNQKYFLSIDLSSANFNCLRYLDPNLVLGVNTYPELIKKFTKYDYYTKSKHFRVIIFSKILPKIQERIWKSLVFQIRLHLLKLNIIPKGNHFNTGDEVIFEVPKDKIIEIFKKVRKEIDIHFDYSNFVKCESFKLVKLNPDLPFCVKEMIVEKKSYSNGKPFELDKSFVIKPVFKCINRDQAAQCLKYYFDLPFNREFDLSGEESTPFFNFTKIDNTFYNVDHWKKR